MACRADRLAYGVATSADRVKPPRRAGIVFLEAHVEEICAENRIHVSGASRRGRAIRYVGGDLEISIPEIRGQVSYLVALHEIGHLIGPGRSAPRLESEANAWAWALDVSCVEPTAASLRSIGKRLDGYLRWAQARQHRQRPPRIPPPDHLFWKLRAYAGFSRSPDP